MKLNHLRCPAAKRRWLKRRPSSVADVWEVQQREVPACGYGKSEVSAALIHEYTWIYMIHQQGGNAFLATWTRATVTWVQDHGPLEGTLSRLLRICWFQALRKNQATLIAIPDDSWSEFSPLVTRGKAFCGFPNSNECPPFNPFVLFLVPSCRIYATPLAAT